MKKEEDEGGNLFEMFLETLWNALLELDDLSPSARPIMSLLAKLCERKETRDMFNVTKVAPRLWPFATHPIASVREAMWQTISELAGTLLENDSFVEAHLADFMTLALQGCALDEDDGASIAAKKAILLVLELCDGKNDAKGKTLVAKSRRNFQNQSRCVFESFERASEQNVRRTLHISKETGKDDWRSAQCSRRLALSYQGAVVRYRVCGESVGMFASNNRRRRIIIRRRGRRNADGIPKRKSDGIIEAWDCRRSSRRVSHLRKISRNRGECVEN